MRRTPAAVIAAVFVALTVSGCNQSYLAPDPATCKSALQAEYLRATHGQGHFETDLAACKGLPKSQVQQFVRQITTGR